MKSEPKVTVLMSVYNGGKHLREAIGSILTQVFSDFEFLIIDDSSTDDSVEIIRSYNDKRIRLINNETNIGLAASLNKGFDLALGEYIARMDSDDISLPERLLKQVMFMDNNPDVGISGTWIRYIGERKGKVIRYPSDNETIKSSLLFDPPLAHPSVIMRKALLFKYNLYYDPSYRKAQDYELWARAANHISFSNIEDILLLYRTDRAKSLTESYKEQQEAAATVRLAQLNNLGLRPTSEEFGIHQAICTCDAMPDEDFFIKADTWLCRIKEANEMKNIYPEPAFSKVLVERWFTFCKKTVGGGSWLLKLFSADRLLEKTGLGRRYAVGFLFRNVAERLREMLSFKYRTGGI